MTEKQIERLTRRKRPDAQARVLVDAGIVFRMVDGRPVVPEDQFKTQQERPSGELVLDGRLA